MPYGLFVPDISCRPVGVVIRTPPDAIKREVNSGGVGNPSRNTLRDGPAHSTNWVCHGFLPERQARTARKAEDEGYARCRRRHQPRRPSLAKIRPGRPAPAMGPGTAASPPNRICATSANPTVPVNATREISSPPAVVSVKKFCPLPLRGSKKLNKVPDWSKALTIAEPLAVASRLKTASPLFLSKLHPKASPTTQRLRLLSAARSSSRWT
jgi:hypothetical protein